MNTPQSTAEKNARATARGDYSRWLASRFGSLDMMNVKEGEDKVHLRNIYIPLRIGLEDQADESMRQEGELAQEQLLGDDARKVIIENSFVAISGRPGSGKTTLVQAIINELCSSGESSFRIAMVGSDGVLPIPLILRDYQDELHNINSLDELLACWWSKAQEEAQDKKKYTGATLDIARLKQSYDGSCDHIPLLLLFDGIDELGGIEARNKMVKLAIEAEFSGNRVILTGRPSGYEGLDLNQHRGEYRDQHMESEKDGRKRKNMQLAIFLRPTIQLHHAQPFAWPQIQKFINKFYQLHDEWKVERERGIADINTALQSRDYLLTLARRPIFLTLMALVHVNDRRMPHGRADLYRRIIDLYLIRQTQQRRLKYTREGKDMPHWEDQEVRRCLAYLAWLSQHQGSKGEEAEERDNRQVIWSRQAMLQALQKLLRGEVEAYHGHFRNIEPQQAEMLLDYYLHPAGLLVEPAQDQIQFTHLSFQEYLCAEYIHGRALAGGSRHFLTAIEQHLYQQLHLPGWDEVAMLLLTIHAGQGAQTEPTAHLELLAELDPAQLPQAKLLINALTGQELDYSENELKCWLPLAVAAALIHPNAEFPTQLATVSAWKVPGLALLKALFKADDCWAVLTDVLQQQPPQSFLIELQQEHTVNNDMQRRWQQPIDDSSWNVEYGDKEARAHALLQLTATAGWLTPNIELVELSPIGDIELETIISHWVKQQSNIFYHYDEENIPITTPSGFLLDSLMPDQGELWEIAAKLMPLDGYLLQGEYFDENDFWELFSQPSLLFSLYPQVTLPHNLVLALGLYQCLQVTENLAQGEAFGKFHESLSQSLSKSLSWSRSRSRSPWRWRSLWRSRSLSRSLSWSRSRSRSLSRSLSLSPLRLQLLINNGHLSDALCGTLQVVVSSVEHSSEIQKKYFLNILELFGYRYAADDWFNEQAESPDLMQRRGLRAWQPLPPELGLFDEVGRLKGSLPRQALLNLAEWLEDDEKILKWFFPESIADDEWRSDLLSQMQRLRSQPWSPQKAVAATLADWPEKVGHRDTTLTAIEQPLIEACETLLKNSK